jgi:hypothetical protein
MKKQDYRRGFKSVEFCTLSKVDLKYFRILFDAAHASTCTCNSLLKKKHGKRHRNKHQTSKSLLQAKLNQVAYLYQVAPLRKTVVGLKD